jgi:molybdopterin biosynthesis enzyme MoaB
MSIRGGFLCIPAADEDTSAAIFHRLKEAMPGFFLLRDQPIADNRYLLEETLRRWCDEEELDLIITLGGTGFAPGPSPQEIVPDATMAVVERLVPGLPEQMRAIAQEAEPEALLERCVAGIRGRTLILNLPAGLPMAVLFLDAVIDLLAPAVARLQREGQEPPDSQSDPGDSMEIPLSATSAGKKKGLDPEEFAKFLRERAMRDRTADDADGP